MSVRERKDEAWWSVQTRRRRWWIAAGAAAVFTIAVGIGLAVGNGSSGSGRSGVAEVVIPLPPPARPATTAKGLPAGGPRAGDGSWLAASPAAEAAYSALPSAPQGPALPPAPDTELIEKQGDLLLPRIAADGRPPFRAYARPFNADDRRPRIAVIITGLAMSAAATDAAIRVLPSAVTLAVSPYGPQACEAIASARLAGHEALLGLPFQHKDSRGGDGGPLAIAAGMPAEQAIGRLNAILARCSGYTGVIGSVVGAAVDGPGTTALLWALRERGLLYVDENRPSPAAERLLTDIGVPWAGADVRIDEDPGRTAIDEQLNRLQEIARSRGSAVGVASPSPLSLARIAAWATRLEERNLQLAPVSAVVFVKRGA